MTCISGEKNAPVPQPVSNLASEPARQHVVVIGGGFGGLQAVPKSRSHLAIVGDRSAAKSGARLRGWGNVA